MVLFGFPLLSVVVLFRTDERVPGRWLVVLVLVVLGSLSSSNDSTTGEDGKSVIPFDWLNFSHESTTIVICKNPFNFVIHPPRFAWFKIEREGGANKKS